MEPFDTLLAGPIVKTLAISLLIVGLITLVAVSLLWRLEKMAFSDVPAWVWTVLIFLIAWSTQYVLSS